MGPIGHASVGRAWQTEGTRPAHTSSPPPANQLSAPPLTGVSEPGHILLRLAQPQPGLDLVSAPKHQGQRIPKPDGLSQGTIQTAQQKE